MKLRLILTLLFFATINLFGQKNKCFTLDSLVKQTLKALETKDVNLYLEMWDTTKFIEAVKGKNDKLLSKVNTLTELHKRNFNALLKQMKVQLFTDQYQITLIKYDPMTPMDMGWMTASGCEIIFVINGVTRKISAPISEYQGCYYFFEPIDDMLRDD